MNNNTTTSYFAVIRHGERADNVASEMQPNNFDNIHDPPLTLKGI